MPLDQQDPSLWDTELVALGERYLDHTAARGYLERRRAQLLGRDRGSLAP